MHDWLQPWGKQAAQGCKALFWKNTSPYASAGPWRNSYQPWATTRKTVRQMPSPWRTDDFHRQHAAITRAMLMNLRHLAERFSRGVILRRHLPKQFQNPPLYISLEAGAWHVKTVGYRPPCDLVRSGGR